MFDDPIVDEIRKYRQEHAEKYNHDLQLIYEAVKQKEKESSRPLISRCPKRIKEETVAE